MEVCKIIMCINKCHVKNNEFKETNVVHHN